MMAPSQQSKSYDQMVFENQELIKQIQAHQKEQQTLQEKYNKILEDKQRLKFTIDELQEFKDQEEVRQQRHERALKEKQKIIDKQATEIKECKNLIDFKEAQEIKKIEEVTELKKQVKNLEITIQTMKDQ